MINRNFLQESGLQYRIRFLEAELELFKSGEKYVRMREQHRKETDALRREIAKLKKELEAAHTMSILKKRHARPVEGKTSFSRAGRKKNSKRT